MIPRRLSGRGMYDKCPATIQSIGDGPEQKADANVVGADPRPRRTHGVPLPGDGFDVHDSTGNGIHDGDARALHGPMATGPACAAARRPWGTHRSARAQRPVAPPSGPLLARPGDGRRECRARLRDEHGGWASPRRSRHARVARLPRERGLSRAARARDAGHSHSDAEYRLHDRHPGRPDHRVWLRSGVSESARGPTSRPRSALSPDNPGRACRPDGPVGRGFPRWSRTPRCGLGSERRADVDGGNAGDGRSPPVQPMPSMEESGGPSKCSQWWPSQLMQSPRGDT